MYDILSIAATIALFALSIVYLHGCESLIRSRKPVPNA
jgi:hypothetical protein